MASDAAVGGAYAQAGADTFAAASVWIDSYMQKELADKYRKEDLAMAKENRDIYLRQQGFENKIASGSAKLQKDEFNFGKQKWGQQWQFEQQKYRDQREDQEKATKQNELNTAVATLANASKSNAEFSNYLRSNFQR
jgi:hypothetical protein